MLTSELRELPDTKPIRLRNVICPYCGVTLSNEDSTKEHVVGRRFVPKGTLNNQWNLIVNACHACNNRKADLEDDISAITMQPDITGRHFGSHPQLAADAAYKAQRTRSRFTRKPVSVSAPTLNIVHQFAPGVTMTFNMIGQAQIDDRRLYELAKMHFQAFFYFVTYNQKENRGWWWKGSYAPILAVSRNDWGNDVVRAFMNKTRTWDPRVLAHTAAGHFRLAIRKHLSEDVWSLAVEWNENYRVFAACGEEEILKRVFEDMPKLKMETISQSTNSILRTRTEKGLSDEDDILFDFIAESEPTGAHERPKSENTTDGH